MPAILILWNAERIVDYCGHANVLIAAFALFILRFTGLALMDSPWYALLTHSLESITLVLVLVTLVLYMRHLVPRRLIASGQAVPVIATLCIGNAIGKLIAPVYQHGFKYAFDNNLSKNCMPFFSFLNIVNRCFFLGICCSVIWPLLLQSWAACTSFYTIVIWENDVRPHNSLHQHHLTCKHTPTNQTHRHQPMATITHH